VQHYAVGAQAVLGHRTFQSDESLVLLKDIYENPEEFVLSIERYSCSVVSIIGWGSNTNMNSINNIRNTEE
jgi:hypothetical protein